MFDKLFYSTSIEGDTISLSEVESRHAVKVFRMQEGDEIFITDGSGHLYKCRIIKSNKKILDAQILSRTFYDKPRDYKIEIGIAPTKNMSRMEWLIEKGTEIGLDAIHLFTTKHSERKKIRIDRLEKTAISAMKQSQQFYLPQIHPIESFTNFIIKQKNNKARKLICHLGQVSQPLMKFISNDHLLLLIGPEGDFNAQEIKYAIEQGFQKVHLGANRLRTETAGLAAVIAKASFHWK